MKCLVSVASNVSEVSHEAGFGVVNKPKTLLTEVCIFSFLSLLCLYFST